MAAGFFTLGRSVFVRYSQNVPKLSPHGRIRPVSRGTRFEKLRGLKCFELVYERIRQGWPITEVARYIQEDKLEYMDVTRGGLVQILTDFRKTIPAADLVEKRMPGDFIAAKEKIADGLDEISEMEELYKMQMERIKIDFHTEKKINKLMPSMTSEIKEARSLLESMATLKMELGLKQRAPQEHTVNMEVEGQLSKDLAMNYGSVAAKKVIENAESRRKVQGVVERFLKLSNAGAVDEKPEDAVSE